MDATKETRGFYASALFNQTLPLLYKRRKPEQALSDLYPTLGSGQTSLRKLSIDTCNLAAKTTAATIATFVVRFSESINQLPTFDAIRAVEKNEKTQLGYLLINAQDNGSSCHDEGQD